MISARVSETVVISLDSLTANLPVALSRATKKIIYGMQKDIAREVKAKFYYPEDPNRLSSVWFDRAGAKISSAKLVYKHKAISLSRYKVEQVRITVKKRKLAVTKRGNSWQRRVLPEASEEQIATYVQVRRSGGLKLVYDKRSNLVNGQRLKGFLHTGRKRGELGFDGQSNQFSSRIFVRNQQPTWHNGQRLPIHALWGPSLLNLLETKELQDLMEQGQYLTKLTTIFSQELKL